MQYLALLYSDEDARPNPAKPGFDKVMQGYARAGRTFHETGVYVDAAPLQPTATATSVRVRDGRTETTDGPFAETKERLGGYYLLDCRGLEHAIEMASLIPAAEYGTVELRPIMHIPGDG
jgi:hypothetical protein